MAALRTSMLEAFMQPMQAAFGWSRSQFSLGFTIQMLPGLAFPPLIGLLIDHWGPRRVAVAGAIVVGLALALFATATGSIANWFVLWLIYGVAGQLIGVNLWHAAVASVFDASRGLAISVIMSGSALAGIVGPIMANVCPGRR